MILFCRIFLFISLCSIFLDASDIREGRITGGHEAEPHSNPYVVSLQSKFLRFRYRICTGSVLSERWILSAGHCVTDSWAKWFDMEAIIGAHNLARLTTSMIYPISHRIAHPYYAGGVGPYDIAMMKTSRRIEFSENVQPIRLPMMAPVLRKNNKFLITGWGALQSNYFITEIPNKLHEVKVTYLPYHECYNAINHIKDDYESNPLRRVHNICTGPISGGIAGCTGDSGGPLVRYLPASAFASEETTTTESSTTAGTTFYPTSKPTKSPSTTSSTTTESTTTAGNILSTTDMLTNSPSTNVATIISASTSIANTITTAAPTTAASTIVTITTETATTAAATSETTAASTTAATDIEVTATEISTTVASTAEMTTTEASTTAPTTAEITTTAASTTAATTAEITTTKTSTTLVTTEATPTEAATSETTTMEITTTEATTTAGTFTKITTDTVTIEATTFRETTLANTTPTVTTPEVTTPEMTTPEVTTPEITTPEVTTPEITTPEVTTPEITTPEVSTPENMTTTEATTELRRKLWNDRYKHVNQGGNRRKINNLRYYYYEDYNKDGYVPMVIGVVSWGVVPCGERGAPTVYSNVTHYMDFINKYLTSD